MIYLFFDRQSYSDIMIERNYWDKNLSSNQQSINFTMRTMLKRYSYTIHTYTGSQSVQVWIRWRGQSVDACMDSINEKETKVQRLIGIVQTWKLKTSCYAKMFNVRELSLQFPRLLSTLIKMRKATIRIVKLSFICNSSNWKSD